MAEYFIRFSGNEEWLRNDLRRGYSFHSYQFADTAEELLEEAGYDLEEYDIDSLIDEYNVAQNSNGQYGFALAGLCGYGPFESVEEAQAEAKNGSYGIYTTCGIFEGRSVGLDPDLNELFRPFALVKVFDTQEVTA